MNADKFTYVPSFETSGINIYNDNIVVHTPAQTSGVLVDVNIHSKHAAVVTNGKVEVKAMSKKPYKMSGDYFVSVDVLKSIPSFDASKVNATQDGFVSLNSLRNAGIEVREMLDFNKIQIANYSPGDNITLSKANPNDYFTELNKNLNN